MDIDNIKYRVKELKKLKKYSKVGTPQRRDINKKIRELKKLEKELYNVTPEKAELIRKIYRLRPNYKTLRTFDLKKFTIKQLQYHYNKIRRK